MNLQADTIVSILPTLSENDLAKIRQATDVLIGKQSIDEPTDKNEQLIFHSVKQELASIGIRHNIPYSQFSESRAYKAWRKGVVIFNNFLEDSFERYLKNEAHRMAMTQILVQTIIADLKKRDIAVSISTIAYNLQRVQQAFDNSFPGYLNSGLEYLIPMSMVKKIKT